MNKITLEQKKSIIDSMALILSPFITLFLIYPIVNSIFHSNHFGVKEFLITMCFQFGSAGLATTLIMIFRKETFASYGIVRENALKSILLSPLVFIPQIMLNFSTKKFYVHTT